MRCDCIVIHDADSGDPRVAAVHRRFRYRCICCRSSLDLEIHSLIKLAKMVSEISVTVCLKCHGLIANGTINVSQNPTAIDVMNEYEK